MFLHLMIGGVNFQRGFDLIPQPLAGLLFNVLVLVGTVIVRNCS